MKIRTGTDTDDCVLCGLCTVQRLVSTSIPTSYRCLACLHTCTCLQQTIVVSVNGLTHVPAVTPSLILILN